MRKLLVSVLVVLSVFGLSYAEDVYVNGYTKKDGTYVEPHYRSSPDNTVTNNYGYKGNTNPYTGEIGNNYYRNNPTSQYYGSTSSNQQPGYQYQPRYNNQNNNNNYGSRPSYFNQPLNLQGEME